MAVKRSASPQGRTAGISVSAAKYSSEDCATLVQYTIAIVEYTRRCGPLKAAMERMHELEREIEENERMQKQAEAEVLYHGFMSQLFLKSEFCQPAPPPLPLFVSCSVLLIACFFLPSPF